MDDCAAPGHRLVQVWLVGAHSSVPAAGGSPTVAGALAAQGSLRAYYVLCSVERQKHQPNEDIQKSKITPAKQAPLVRRQDGTQRPVIGHEARVSIPAPACRSKARPGIHPDPIHCAVSLLSPILTLALALALIATYTPSLCFAVLRPALCCVAAPTSAR
jgi:hypothetical protein